MSKKKKRDGKSKSPPPRPAARTPLTPTATSQYKRDYNAMSRTGKDMAKLDAVVKDLMNHVQLLPIRVDHALGGKWKGWRDCHVEGDWILIYKKDGSQLILGRTGTHSELKF